MAHQDAKKALTDRTAKAWHSALTRFVYPTLGALDIRDVRHAHIVAALKPVALAAGPKNKGLGGPHVANSLRSRLERIIDWAGSHGWRDADAVNPARRELLRDVIGSRAQVVHFATCAIDDAPALYAKIAGAGGSIYRAIELLLLTAVRLRECLDARFSEFDLEREIWVIPSSRTKTKREHVVPLSAPALAIVRGQQALYSGEVIFPGRGGSPFGSFTALEALRRLGVEGVTLHGFRSLCRDVMADRLEIDHETAEFILAHVKRGVEGAYRRETALAKRAVAMQRYADFLLGKAAETNVVAFARK